MELSNRPRRLRGNGILRKMVRETRIDPSSLVYPMFVMEGSNKKEEIPSMPGQYRYSGISAARLVARVSEGRAEIIFFDSNKKLSVADVQKKLPDGIGAEIHTGILPEEVAGRTDLVILSPGVPVDRKSVV